MHRAEVSQFGALDTWTPKSSDKCKPNKRPAIPPLTCPKDSQIKSDHCLGTFWQTSERGKAKRQKRQFGLRRGHKRASKEPPGSFSAASNAPAVAFCSGVATQKLVAAWDANLGPRVAYPPQTNMEAPRTFL